MKYVDSPSMKGGQLRVSSPLPGSSILMTSAPMSASVIAQKGPARTRVRSRTRRPDRGCGAPRRAVGFLVGTSLSFQDTLGEAACEPVHPVARAARAAPEDPRAVERPQVREIVHV